MSLRMHPLIVSDASAITLLLARSKRIAVLGIKTEAQVGQPAFDVPAYMLAAGFDVVPVPVYYPDATHILGQPVYRTVSAIPVPPPVDLVNVFRRPQDLAKHTQDLLAAKPHAVWLQQGIRDDAFALTLAQAGITVVQDRCILVEHRVRHG